MSYILFLSALLFAASSAQFSACLGAFELYFVLEFADGVGDQWHKSISFVRSMMSTFEQDRLKVSIIRFSTNPIIDSPLTDDLASVAQTLDRLELETGSGNNCMAGGLRAVQDDWRARGQGGVLSIPVLFLVSHGAANACGQENLSRRTAAELRSAGMNIFSIGVGEQINRDFLLDIASSPPEEFNFYANDYDGLSLVVDALKEDLCIGVTAIRPHVFCLGEFPQNLEIWGRNFHTDDAFAVSATCKIESGLVQAVVKDDGLMACVMPDLQADATVLITIFSRAYILKEYSHLVFVEDCSPPIYTELPVTYPTYAPVNPSPQQPLESESSPWSWILPFLLILLLLLSCCLWYFWFLLCGFERKEPEHIPAQEALYQPPLPVQMVAEPILAPKPGPAPAALKKPKIKKWGIVNASGYIWATNKTGSAAPMTVQWGKKGAVLSSPGCQKQELLLSVESSVASVAPSEASFRSISMHSVSLESEAEAEEEEEEEACACWAACARACLSNCVCLASLYAAVEASRPKPPSSASSSMEMRSSSLIARLGDYEGA